MSAAIIAAFNDATTQFEIIALINEHQVALGLSAGSLAKYNELPAGQGRQQAIGLGVKASADLIGDYADLAAIKAAVEKQIDVEYAKYEFINAIDSAAGGTPELEIAAMVQALTTYAPRLDQDRQDLIAEWGAIQGNDALAVVVKTLTESNFTTVLKHFTAHMNDAAYLNELATDLLAARAANGGKFFGDGRITTAMKASIDADILADLDAAFAIGDLEARRAEILTVIDSNSEILLTGDWATKFSQLPAGGGRLKAIADGVQEVATLFGPYTDVARLKGELEQQVKVEHTKFLFITALDSATTVDQIIAALTTYVDDLNDHRQDLIAQWGASTAEAVLARVAELQIDSYTTVLKLIDSHLGDPAIIADLAASLLAARGGLPGGQFYGVVNIINAMDAFNFDPEAPATSAVVVNEDGSVTSAIGATDADGDTLTYTVKTGAEPTKGTVTFANGQFTYVPTTNANGEDTFTIVIDDGKGGRINQVVTVTITPVNDAPTADPTNMVLTAEDTAQTVDIGATDADGDTLTYALAAGAEPQHGTVTFADGKLTYVPDANYNGPDVFNIVIDDGKGGQIEQAFTVMVAPVNDAPTADQTHLVVADEDNEQTVDIGATDADGDTLTYALATGAEPTKGTVTFANGQFTYVPNTNANGDDTFTIVIDDGKGGRIEQEVTVTITPVNDAPEASAKRAVKTDEDKALTANIGATDPDGDTLTYTVKDNATPKKGTVTFANGQFTYVPNPNANGQDTFTIVIDDLKGGRIEQEVTVTITAVNDAPTAITINGGSTASVAENATNLAVVGTLATADVDGGAMTYSLVDDAGGRFTIVGDKVVVKDGSQLDFEQTKTHQVKVKATDSGGASFEQIFSVGVLDVLVETITGTTGDDVYVGGMGGDNLDGGAGNDIISGRLGKDILKGGDGKDIFVFDTAPNKKTNLDKIADFKVKDDSVYLDNAIFKKLGKGSLENPGKLKKAFFTIGDSAQDSNDYVIYDNKKGVLYYDADGSGAGKAVEIAKLGKNLKMTSADFFVI